MRVKVPAGRNLARGQAPHLVIDVQARAFASSSRQTAGALIPPAAQQYRIRPVPVGAPRVPHLSTRHGSSSPSWSPFSRIFGRRGKSVTSPDDDFRQALARRDVGSLCSAYDRLAAAAAADRNTSTPSNFNGIQLVSPDERIGAMQLLARTRRRGAMDVLRKLYRSTSGPDGQATEASRAMLAGLCLNGHVNEAYSLATDLAAAGTGADIDWIEIGAAAVRFRPEMVEEVLARAAQYEPPIDVLTLRLRHVRINEEHRAAIGDLVSEVEQTLGELLESRQPRSSYISVAGMAELVRIHVKLGQFDHAAELIDAHVSEGERLRNTAMRNAIIELRGAKGDLDGVREVVMQMRGAGDEPPHRAVLYLAAGRLRQGRDQAAQQLGSEALVEAIDYAERETGLQAPASVWAEILHSYLVDGTDSFRSGRLEQALEAYHVGKARGVLVDTQLARTLIKPLCLSQPPALDDAMSIYRDWQGSEVAPSHALEKEHITDLYTALLRAAAGAKSPSTAIILFTDLRERKLPLPAAGATSLLIALLPTAKDHKEAFNLYAQFYALNVHSMTRGDYEAILSAFLAFSTPLSPFAPTYLYLEILRDMRKSGYAPGSESLTSLLSSYIRQARVASRGPGTRESQRQLSDLNEAVEEIHNLIHLDTLVDTDVPLLSALMNAYSHLGSYRSAFDVWTELLERRPREDPARVPALYAPALSVILDTCGFSANPERAVRIWAWAQRWKIPNERNWLAYIECLCRADRIDQAADLVFGDMREWNRQHGISQPNNISRDAVEILLRFSWRSQKAYSDVQERVRLEVPELWEEVKGIVETRTARLRARQNNV